MGTCYYCISLLLSCLSYWSSRSHQPYHHGRLPKSVPSICYPFMTIFIKQQSVTTYLSKDSFNFIHQIPFETSDLSLVHAPGACTWAIIMHSIGGSIFPEGVQRAKLHSKAVIIYTKLSHSDKQLTRGWDHWSICHTSAQIYSPLWVSRPWQRAVIQHY